MNAKPTETPAKPVGKLTVIAGALIAVLGVMTASASAAPGEFTTRYTVDSAYGAIDLSGAAGFGTTEFSNWSGTLYGDPSFEPRYEGIVNSGSGFFIAKKRNGKLVGNGKISADLTADLYQTGSYWKAGVTERCDGPRVVELEPEIIFRSVTPTGGGKVIWDPGAFEGLIPLPPSKMVAVAPSWRCGAGGIRFWKKGPCVSNDAPKLAAFKKPFMNIRLSCKPDEEYEAPGGHFVAVNGSHSMRVIVDAR
jgi:hypothetical protein